MVVLLIIFTLSMPLPFYITSYMKQIISTVGKYDSVSTFLFMIQTIFSSVMVLANVMFVYFVKSYVKSLIFQISLCILIGLTMP